MTAAAIGIALALPTAFYLFVKNASAVSEGWDGAPRISLYLNKAVDSNTVVALEKELELRDAIAAVHHITPEQALKEFRSLSGIGDALEALPDNPLPTVLVVHLAVAGAARIEALAKEFKELEAVDLAQIDLEWVKRLYAIVQLAHRGVILVAVLLGMGILLIVGNIIRLDILSRQEEIQVTKLIGATDGFIRRPFLYGGLWYGLFGGLIAWVLVAITFALLTEPVRYLASLYGSEFELLKLKFPLILALIGIGGGLGLLGSWLAVDRHLNRIAPL
jgi:cell division transport system permease protein